MIISNDEEASKPTPRGVLHHDETHAHTVIRYSDGTVREDFKSEGLNEFLGSARPRRDGDQVGEVFEEVKLKEPRTSHERGWVRFSDYR
jgi:hypothetical protein